MVRRIGAHITIGKGLRFTVAKALRIGANCLQVFSSPPVQWRSSTFTPAELNEFKTLLVKQDIQPVFVHAVYLINLASDNKIIRQRSADALILDLAFAKATGAPGVIFHLGSHRLGWTGKKRQQLITVFRQILDNSPRETLVIVENSAGAGGKIGSKLEDLRKIKDDLKSARIAFCLDTQHAFAAGYDLRTAILVNRFVDEVDSRLGWDQVVAIHANDSKTPFGKTADRHENIGKGYIGLEGFRALINHPKLANKPMIIETPGFADEGPDKQNIDILRSLIYN